MATFKVFDPTTGQYVEKEVEGMTAAAEAVQEAAAPVVEAVQEAAERCGFSSPRYFYTVFRKQTGVTPGEFRKEMEDAGFIRS